ncbi:MAG: putative baseplate assembly protein [Blastocatellia bacterium]
MNLITPKIDARGFQALLRQAQSLAPFYAPEWIAGRQGEPGQALLNIYLHLQEQVLGRLNRTPDKNFVAFLDMMGFKLLPAQPAQAGVTFTLANGTTEHVLVPRGTLLSGQAAGGEAIFQTQQDLLVTPAILQQVYSYDASRDSIHEHKQSDKEPIPFTVFDGENKQEHSLYLGHADLFNQKKPTKIEVEFILAELASDGSNLTMLWEYYDGDRWTIITRFDRDRDTGEFDEQDGTRLLTKSGVMELTKGNTGEIAETEIGGVKNRWIRCRIVNGLPRVASIRLPVINNVRIGINPIEAFAPDLAFSNDIPLNLEEIRISMEAMSANLKFAQDSPDPLNRKIIHLQNPDGALIAGDFLLLDNTFDGVEIREIVTIDNGDITLNEVLRFRYDTTSTVFLHTALRPDGTSVRVKSLEGVEVSANSKAALFHRGQKEDADLTGISPEVPPNKTVLTIKRKGNAASKPFYIKGDVIRVTPKIKPFGELPQVFDAFYIASDEAFSKKGAEVTLKIDSELRKPDTRPKDLQAEIKKLTPVLSWEYWNGKSWRGIRVTDTTNRFLKDGSGTISFTCPDDIEKVEANGEEKFWIRARIIDGDYGREILIEPKPNGGAEVDIKKGHIYFPIISDLKIEYKTVKEEPQKCLALNNLNLEDHTLDSIDESRVFAPFAILPEQFPSLFLGFDKALTGGPLKILFDVDEQFLDQDERLKMPWFYWDGVDWAQLNVVDETENLTRIGLLKFVTGRNFARRKLFGKEQFWLKASVVEGSHPKPPRIKSIHPNTTYALQADVASNELAGSSDGTGNQEFTLQHPLVISQRVFVRELFPPDEEEQQAIRKEEGKDAITDKKNEFGETVETLVTWHEVEDFDESGAKSRHYTIDRRLGKIKFGDGKRGLVPPVGADNIIVSYTFGGGKNGNVPVNAISGLKSAVPFVNAVTNPLAADGGSETETLESVLASAPLRLKNRGRAVTPEDFESLAKSVSRKVARAKCLPNIDGNRDVAPGWVTVMIVPDSDGAKPQPSRLLLKVVTEGLEKLSANAVAGPGHIHVTGPDYSEVIVEASVVPASLDKAAAVETAVSGKLKKYIHPLTGGPHGTGWEFGREICLSDIFALIESIEDVDHVEKIVLRVNGKPYEGNVRLDKYSLPFSGEHEISITLGGARDGFDPCKAFKTECAERQEIKLVACEEKETKA